MSNEKHEDTIEPAQSSTDSINIGKADLEDGEVSRTGEGFVNFRTVSWIHTSVIFLKHDVLTIPSAMFTLGALPDAINMLGWQFPNTYIANMGQLVGGRDVKEIAGILFLVAFISVGASGMVEKLTWITWVVFASVFIAMFIVVVGVTTLGRTAAAPQSRDYEFGYHIIASPTFAAGITAVSTIFCSSAGTSAFVPAVSWCMGIGTAAYLSFSLVFYKYCGQWVASPSLGSTVPMVKQIVYGIGLVGLCVSGALYVHVSAEYVFVRILRKSKHLQANTAIHWGTWFGFVTGIGITSFLIASGVPIFNYLLSLAGSIAFAPLALGLPGWLWIYDHADYWRGNLWRKTLYGVHIILILISAFLTIGGTYGVMVQIMDAYKDGSIDSAFSCADNSNSS
ncbi:hypothetical protein BU25DRAFT_440674 [Macroventuria anomochaeta]|uniref:Uncharacterized protein n=1 Tax=Macroventuria anomochaeta TaxID=301207 RepID=A0ACB6RZ75_9PLEO|nr:uncharacterized protein BU25DRAFT_440674 [Macroventuria anomochaeta]KAF2626725.1 hypothetical protein BU25DRAFT_440674 [Macroventuria anomochaeta]